MLSHQLECTSTLELTSPKSPEQVDILSGVSRRATSASWSKIQELGESSSARALSGIASCANIKSRGRKGFEVGSNWRNSIVFVEYFLSLVSNPSGHESLAVSR